MRKLKRKIQRFTNSLRRIPGVEIAIVVKYAEDIHLEGAGSGQFVSEASDELALWSEELIEMEEGELTDEEVIQIHDEIERIQKNLNDGSDFI